jgi:hypothetical protein
LTQDWRVLLVFPAQLVPPLCLVPPQERLILFLLRPTHWKLIQFPLLLRSKSPILVQEKMFTISPRQTLAVRFSSLSQSLIRPYCLLFLRRNLASFQSGGVLLMSV